MDNKTLKTHQELGQELELFFTDEVAPGAPFWLPKGMIIFKELEKYIRELTSKAGYQETSTPIMVKTKLFKQSGHWDKFGEGGGHDMYNLSVWEKNEIDDILELLEDELEKKAPGQYKNIKVPIKYEGETFVVEVQRATIEKTEEPEIILTTKGLSLPVNRTLKPMNCPESTILYRFKTRSYRDLPLRLSEIGRLHRREQSGEINGLFRVRQITMDDAHIFAREDQIFDEVSKILDMMEAFYKNFRFEYEFRFATRPETRAGTDEDWDKAEKDLEEVLKKKDIKAGDKKGDGAFYGPKIDMHIKDSLGREWQLATVQLDFHQPQALELEYIDSDGKSQRPVMIHRAIFGSFERFIGILTEHYQGAFPLWLSPIQVSILPITDKHKEHAEKLADELREGGIRVQVDNRAETLQAKIRESTLQKVPYLGIIGDKEVEDGNLLSVRDRKGDSKSLKVSEFLEQLKKEIEQKF